MKCYQFALVKIRSHHADVPIMRSRLIYVGFLGLIVVASRLSHIDWKSIHPPPVNSEATASSSPIQLPVHLKDGRTLRLDLHDDEMLENLEPEPFPDGHLGLLGQWTHQLQTMPQGNPMEWPAWLGPYPGADQAVTLPMPWFPTSNTERSGGLIRTYGSKVPAERVLDHYRRELDHAGIRITADTRIAPGLYVLYGESSNPRRTVRLEISGDSYTVTYGETESGHFTPPPSAPVLDLALESVDEAGKFVRLRNRVDGEILRLPFSVLDSDVK